MKYKNITAQDEHEILLPRNISWKLVKKYKSAIYTFEDTITCTCENIRHSQKHKIVYEFSAMSYKQPHAIEEMTMDTCQNSQTKKKTFKNNPALFTVKNNLPLTVKES